LEKLATVRFQRRGEIDNFGFGFIGSVFGLNRDSRELISCVIRGGRSPLNCRASAALLGARMRIRRALLTARVHSHGPRRPARILAAHTRGRYTLLAASPLARAVALPCCPVPARHSHRQRRRISWARVSVLGFGMRRVNGRQRGDAVGYCLLGLVSYWATVGKGTGTETVGPLDGRVLLGLNGFFGSV